MIEKSVIYKFVSFFDGAESVALLCHVNPDSDTLGSALSLRLALKKLGKRCDVYCDDNPPERLMFLPSVKVVNECEGDKFKKYDVALPSTATIPTVSTSPGNISKTQKKRLSSTITKQTVTLPTSRCATQTRAQPRRL